MREGRIGVPVVTFHDAGAGHFYYATDADAVQNGTIGAHVNRNRLATAFQRDKCVLHVAGWPVLDGSAYTEGATMDSRYDA